MDISSSMFYPKRMEAKQMKKKTRSQKVSENPRGAGKSKYSLKIAARKREAAKLGLQDIPYPVLAVIETETKEPYPPRPPAMGGHLPAALVGDNGRSTRPRQA